MDISCFHYSFSHRDLEWLINYTITYLLSISIFVLPWSFLLNNETCQHSSLGGGGGRPFTTPQCIVSQYWNIWTTTFSYISNDSITLLIPTPDVISSHILSHSLFFSPKWSLCLSHPLLPVFSFKSPLRSEQTYWFSKCLSSNSCLKVTPVRSLPEMYMSYLPIETFTITF